MNYYTTLNIPKTATDDEIKKAYRKLAKQYHPDAGGDETKFKEITEAYSILSDPEKRRLADMGVDPNSAQAGYNFYSNAWNTADLRDIFSNLHNYTDSRNYRKNKSVVTRIQITLEDVLNGKEIDAEIALPGNAEKVITIKIPPGVESGQQIKFEGMGDASIPNLPPGDLLVNVEVLPHSKFERSGAHLIYTHHIPVWDAITGTTLPFVTLAGKNINIKIPAGTQPDTILKCARQGLPVRFLDAHGNLFIKVVVDIPTNLTEEQIKMVEELKESFLTSNKEENA